MNMWARIGMLIDSLFFEIGSIIVLAAALSFVARALKQPLILAYIVTGMLAGAAAFNLARSPEVFHALSEIGVAFLLFTVGLGLNWRSMKDVGATALATGIGQVLFTSGVGFMILRALNFDVATSIFLAVAFAFSSTIIIVKMLFDKGDSDTLYGRISIGFLLVQDLVAMVILLVLGAMQSGGSLQEILAVSFIKGVLAILLLVALSVWVIPHLLKWAARSQELLMIFALGWCFAVAGLLHVAGFGIEIGALLAGVSLSGTMFHHEIIARVRPIRDFFLIIFFIVLGTGLQPGNLDALWLPIVILSIFVLVGNPLIVMFIMRALGHHPHTGFLAGTTVAQISEFSFIVVTVGVAIGLIPAEALVVAASVGILTISGSAYLIQYNEQIYHKIRPLLRWLEPKKGIRFKKFDAQPQVFLCGHHRIGSVLLPDLLSISKRVAVIDYDPRVVENLKEENVDAIYGDCGDENFLGEIELQSAKLVISTVPELTVSLSLLEYLRQHEFKGSIIVTARTAAEAEQAYENGAHFVIVPNILGAERFGGLLKKNKLLKTKWKKMVPKEA